LLAMVGRSELVYTGSTGSARGSKFAFSNPERPWKRAGRGGRGAPLRPGSLLALSYLRARELATVICRTATCRIRYSLGAGALAQSVLGQLLELVHVPVRAKRAQREQSVGGAKGNSFLRAPSSPPL
jgi:hypothetical protein